MSVVIPTFNRRDTLIGAVASAVSQSYPHKEIIVVDDGSTDGTGNMVRRHFPVVRYIYQENRGVSAARNTGIKAAQGEFIAFLDSDDCWLPEKLARQMPWFFRQPSLQLVAGDRVKSKGGVKIPLKPVPDGCPASRVSFFQLLMGRHLPTPSVVVRRQALLAAGLFDTSLPTGEDWDVWLKIASRGAVAYLDAPVVIVRTGDESLSADRLAIYLNNIKVLRRWDPAVNAASPVSRLMYNLAVRYHCCTAVARLARRGQMDEAAVLWQEARRAFGFTATDAFLLKCYAALRGTRITRL